jgi:hypothetical protein
MDTLTTPVILVTIATNSREARFSIGPSKYYIKKEAERSVLVYVGRPAKLVYGSQSPE